MQEFGAASQRDRKRPRTARGSLQAARKPGPTPSLVVAKKDCVAIVKLLQANAAEGSMQHFAGEFAFAANPGNAASKLFSRHFTVNDSTVAGGGLGLFVKDGATVAAGTLLPYLGEVLDEMCEDAYLVPVPGTEVRAIPLPVDAPALPHAQRTSCWQAMGATLARDAFAKPKYFVDAKPMVQRGMECPPRFWAGFMNSSAHRPSVELVDFFATQVRLYRMRVNMIVLRVA